MIYVLADKESNPTTMEVQDKDNFEQKPATEILDSAISVQQTLDSITDDSPIIEEENIIGNTNEIDINTFNEAPIEARKERYEFFLSPFLYQLAC